MSEEINVGDLRVSLSGTEFEVIAAWGDYIWVKWEDSVPPVTQTFNWAKEYTKPKADFFEENATYRHEISHNLWEVKLVVTADGEQFAIMKSPDSKRLFGFNQEDWDAGNYRKV